MPSDLTSDPWFVHKSRKRPYSNVSRGKRRKAQEEDQTDVGDSIDVSAAAAKRAWARLIKQVYEVDPLVCPRCDGPLRILALCAVFDYVKRSASHSSHLLAG